MKLSKECKYKELGRASLSHISSYLRYQEHDLLLLFFIPVGERGAYRAHSISMDTPDSPTLERTHLAARPPMIASTHPPNWKKLTTSEFNSPSTKLPPHDLFSDLVFPEQPARSLWTLASNPYPHPSSEHKLVNLWFFLFAPNSIVITIVLKTLY